jgi:hypothetical protein
MATHTVSVHYIQYKMALDPVTPSAEHCYIIKFIAKEKVKPAEIIHRLNAQYGEETL